MTERTARHRVLCAAHGPPTPASVALGVRPAAGCPLPLWVESADPGAAAAPARLITPAVHDKETSPCPIRCETSPSARRARVPALDPMSSPSQPPADEPPTATPRRAPGPTFTSDPAADAWLVGKARNGDPAAYEALVRRHRVRVYRIALRMLGNHEDAEDVAQDTFVQVWSALAGFVGGAQFTTWLYRIVINRCINHKRRRPPPVPLRDEDHPAGTGPEDAVVAEHRARATAAAIAALPPDQRTVLVLHQMEGLTYQEVADILKLPEPTVRGRLARARRTLITDLRDWA